MVKHTHTQAAQMQAIEETLKRFWKKIPIVPIESERQ